MTHADITQSFDEINSRMESAALRSGRRREDVRLVAVSKKQPVKSILTYLRAATEKRVPVLLGESYVQEYKAKRDLLPGGFEAHLIGPLQSNKIRDAVALFDVIESVHTERVLEMIAHEASKIQKVQRVLLQVNVSKDPQKRGFSPENIAAAVQQAISLPTICVEGLMAITALYSHQDDVRADFQKMRNLLTTLAPLRGERTPLNHLSMGMSEDFEIAIEEGATLVRVGTRLFGERKTGSE